MRARKKHEIKMYNASSDKKNLRGGLWNYVEAH